MKIIRGSIFTLAKKGDVGLNICSPYFPDDHDGDLETIPVDWAVPIKGYRPAVGKESGFLHLTRIGYEANKNDLRKALEGNPKGLTWSEFDQFAQQELKAIEQSTENFCKSLEEKIKQANRIQSYFKK